jgi:superfamily II DNA/RNA helicase
MNPPKPCWTFEHFGFDQSLLDIIKMQSFIEPTPIQKQVREEIEIHYRMKSVYQ